MNRGSLVVGPGLGAGLLVGLGTTDLVVVIIQLSGNGAWVGVTKLGISSSLLGIKVTLFIAKALA